MRPDDFTRQHFTWFTGIVEDITDPEQLNRCKVRCIGYHEDDEKLLPKEKLPWATVIMPVTSAAYQGIGGNHHLEVGSWVVGFFRDGPSAQDPMIMGSVATQENGIKDLPSSSSTTNKVHHTKAGHKIEFENKEGDERIIVQHAKGATIIIDKDNNITVANSGTTTISSSGQITIASAVKTTII